MQASTNIRQTPPGRRAGRGSRVLVAVLAMLLLALFALLEGDKPAQAIIGGSKVKPETYPFMAQLVLTVYDPPTKLWRNVTLCGATLIDKDSVLTAAHCLYYPGEDSQKNPLKDETGKLIAGQPIDPSRLHVIVGTTKKQYPLGELGSVGKIGNNEGQVRGVDTKALCCEDASPPDQGYKPVYDAAVLNLSQPVTESKTVQPIDELALPS